MSEQRLCKYCGQPIPPKRKKNTCCTCSAKRKLVRKLIEVAEPLREASMQRKVRAMLNDR